MPSPPRGSIARDACPRPPSIRPNPRATRTRRLRLRRRRRRRNTSPTPQLPPPRMPLARLSPPRLTPPPPRLSPHRPRACRKWPTRSRWRFTTLAPGLTRRAFERKRLSRGWQRLGRARLDSENSRRMLPGTCRQIPIPCRRFAGRRTRPPRRRSLWSATRRSRARRLTRTRRPRRRRLNEETRSLRRRRDWNRRLGLFGRPENGATTRTNAYKQPTRSPRKPSRPHAPRKRSRTSGLNGWSAPNATSKVRNFPRKPLHETTVTRDFPSRGARRSGYAPRLKPPRRPSSPPWPPRMPRRRPRGTPLEPRRTRRRRRGSRRWRRRLSPRRRRRSSRRRDKKWTPCAGAPMPRNDPRGSTSSSPPRLPRTAASSTPIRPSGRERRRLSPPRWWRLRISFATPSLKSFGRLPKRKRSRRLPTPPNEPPRASPPRRSSVRSSFAPSRTMRRGNTSRFRRPRLTPNPRLRGWSRPTTRWRCTATWASSRGRNARAQSPNSPRRPWPPNGAPRSAGNSRPSRSTRARSFDPSPPPRRRRRRR